VTMKRVIIDTDPGIDDTAAIFLALASPDCRSVNHGLWQWHHCRLHAQRTDYPGAAAAIFPSTKVRASPYGSPELCSACAGRDALGDVGVHRPGVPGRHAV
jgi:hypothetical protein